jgi:tetratricopeptide (TPR) repeat protein
MTSSSIQSEVLEEINRRVDPQILLERIGYHPESIRLIGSMLKCFCPIHQEQKFATLLIDVSKKTFQCTVRTCPAYKRGNLIEFFALYQGQPSLLQAAFALAKFTQIHIDESLLRRLGSDIIAEGGRALEEGRLEEASELVIQALEVDSNSLEAHLLAARLSQARGAMGEALGHAQQAIALAEHAGLLDRAIEIITTVVLELLPEDEESLLHLADLHESAGDVAQARTILQRVANARRDRGDLPATIPILERILSQDVENIEILLLLATALEAAGEPTVAGEKYLAAVELFEKSGDSARALETLEQVRRISPTLWSARELLAEHLRRMKQGEAYVEELLAMGDLALESGEPSRAEHYFREILDQNPDSVEGREGLLRVLEARGNFEALAHEQLVLAELFQRNGRSDRALECLRQARDARKENPEIRKILVEHLLSAGEMEEAIEEMIALGHLFMALSRAEDAAELLGRVSALTRDRVEPRLRVAALYTEAGLVQKALEELLDLLDVLCEGKRWKEALPICEQGLEVDSRSVVLHRRKTQILKALKKHPEAAAAYRPLLALLLAGDDPAAAEKEILEALQLDGENVELLDQLLGLYLTLDRREDALQVGLRLRRIHQRRGAAEPLIAISRQILELDGADLETRTLLASQYVATGMTAEAAVEYEIAGDAYRERGDVDAAREQYQRVVEIEPESIEVLRKLADLVAEHDCFEAAEPYYRHGMDLLRQGDDPEAVAGEYERILSRHPARTEWRRDYAQWLHSQERTQAAYEQYVLLGRIFAEELGDFPAAIAVYKTLVELEPEQIDYRIELGRLYGLNGVKSLSVVQKWKAVDLLLAAERRGDALALIEEIVVLDADDERAREVGADLLQQAGRAEEAIAQLIKLARLRSERDGEADNGPIYRKILEMNPDQLDVRRQLAETLEHGSLVAEAVEQWLLLAEALGRVHRAPEAVEVCRHVTELDPENPEPRRHLVSLLEPLDEPEALKREYDGLVALYHSQGEYDSACDYLRRMIALDPQDLTLPERLGRVFEEQGKTDEACALYLETATRHQHAGENPMARALLVRIKGLQPARVEARLLLSQVCESLGEERSAAREHLDLIEFALNDGDLDRARRHGDQIARLAGAHWDLYLDMARAFSRHEESTEAIERLGAAIAEALRLGDAANALLLLEEALALNANARSLREQRVEAFRMLDRADDVAAEYRILADLAVADKDPEAAALYYQSLLELTPEDIASRGVLADLLLQLGDEAAGIEELTRVITFQTQTGDREAAAQVAGRILQLDPDRDDIRLLRVGACLELGLVDQAVDDLNSLAERALHQADWVAAEEHLRRVLEIAPEALSPVRRLAEIIREHRSVEDARPILRRQIELATEQLSSDEIQAEFRRILELDPENPDFHLEFARYLHGADREGESAESYRRAAALCEQSGDYQEALAIIGELSQRRPEDFSLLGRQAQLLTRLDRAEEARECYIRAGEGLIARTEIAAGVGMLLRALEINQNDAPLLERVAELYENSNAMQQAADLYLRLADFHQNGECFDEEIRYLHKVLTLAPENAEVCRRLAQGYEDTGNGEKAVQFWLTFVEKNTSDDAPDVALRVWTHIKEVDPTTRENRTRLIAEYQRRNDLDGAKLELIELVDLCEGLGDLAEVEKLLREGLALDSEDRYFRRRLGDFYAQQNQPEEAMRVLSELAALCRSQGDSGESVALYRRILEIRPEEFSVREQLVELLRELGKSAEAAAEAEHLAHAYLQAGHLSDALVWLDFAVEHGGECPAQARRGAELLVRAEHAEEARGWMLRQACRREDLKTPEDARAILLAALEFFPGDIELLESLLELLKRLEQWQEALEICKALAHSLRDSGDLERLELTWMQALEIAPEDIESHEGYISVLEAGGESRRRETLEAMLRLSALHRSADRTRQSIECHRRCLMLAPERGELRDELAQMLLAIGDWPSALEEYLALAQEKLDARAIEPARHYYEKVLELDAENIDALRTLIQITREQNDREAHTRYSIRLAAIFVQVSALNDAIQCYRELVDFNPEPIEAWETLGSLLEQENRLDEAIEARRHVADHYEKGGDLFAALENLRKMEAHRPDDLDTCRRLAALALRAGDPDAPERYQRLIGLAETLGTLEEATQAAQTLCELLPGDPAPHRKLAALYQAQNQSESAVQALSTASSLHENRGEAEEAALLLADLLALAPERHADRERYVALLQAVGETQTAVEQLLVLAGNYEREEAVPRAISRCRDALALMPDTLEAHIRLERLYAARNEVPLALAEITWLLDYFTQKRETDKVLEYLERGLQLDGQNMGLMERLAEIHLHAGRLDEATNQYLRMAEAALVRGDIPRATRSMENARDSSPDDVEIRRNLAEIYVRQGDSTSARSEFFEVARLYLAQGLVADARATLDALIIQNPKDTALRERAAGLYVDHGIPELASLQYVELARLHKQSRNAEGVVRFAQSALELKPRTIEAKELLVEAQIMLEDLDGAYATYSDLAELYAQTGQPERSANCLRPMIEMKPDDPEPRRRLIDIFQRLNQLDQAVEQMFALAGLHAETGQLEQAVAVYRAILDARPDDTRARVAYIETYSQIGPEQDLVDDYIHLAKLFAARREIEQAAQAYEKALGIAPNATHHREAYIEFLLSASDPDRAQREADQLSRTLLEGGKFREVVVLLQKVLAVARDNTALRLRLAEAHSRLNARGMALKELRLVVQSCERANDIEALIRTFRFILDIDPQNVETRQKLIELLQRQGRIDDVVEERMQLAEVFVGRGLLDLARDEYRELLQLNPRNLTGWNYLISTRQQLGEEEQLVGDYIALGRVHESQGNIQQAVETYRNALDLDERNLEARRCYVEAARQIITETELVDDYLALADALVAANQVDEAVLLYSHVMSIDPANEGARKKLADTQARRAGMIIVPPPGTPPPAPYKPATPIPAPSAGPFPESVPALEPEVRFPTDFEAMPELGIELGEPPSPTPEAPATPEVVVLQEEEMGLEQVAANYLDILQVNPQNANVRLKLADIYEQIGKTAEALAELVQASEIFFQKSELNMCVSVCERILKKDPTDGRVRERLSKAVLKRDAFKALESAIMFSDQTSQPEPETRKSNSSKKQKK